MNSKGFELAISTIVVLVVGVLVLIGFFYFITDGFGNFKSGTEPLIQGSSSGAVKQACDVACQTEDTFTYCCQDFELSGENVRCDDERLTVECDLSCAAVSCAA